MSGEEGHYTGLHHSAVRNKSYLQENHVDKAVFAEPL